MDLVTENYSMTTDVADAISQISGIGYRLVYNVVGQVVDEAIEHGKLLSDISAQDLMKKASTLGIPVHVTDEQLKDAMNPQRALEKRTHIGGSAKKTMAVSLVHGQTLINDVNTWVSNQKQIVSKAKSKTESIAQRDHSGENSMSTQTLLSSLVKIPSYSGQERALAAFIMQWAHAHGIQAELQNGNVLIPFVAGSSKALIFDAHMDTVTPGAENLWNVPPTGSGAGVIKNGKLYGLGASDDKAAIASFLLLAQELQRSPPPLDVFIVFVSCEETDGSGSQSFVQYFQKNHARKYQKVAVIIGEPTDLQTIEIGHRGNMFLQVATHGDTGHGSQPQQIKTHAVLEHVKIIKKLLP